MRSLTDGRFCGRGKEVHPWFSRYVFVVDVTFHLAQEAQVAYDY